MRRILWILLFILILGSWIWGIYQWQEVQEKLIKLEKDIEGISKTGGVSLPQEKKETGYEITVDMWQIFEKELQDYKQRLREGKRQYSEQQTSWNKILNELKKSLQEYDKFIAAEGEFWEKQLRNYEKLLAKTEDRFEALGQVIDDLSSLFVDFQKWWEAQREQLKTQAMEMKEQEAEEEVIERKPTFIKPRIKGRGEYKTYPPQGEEYEKEVITETEEGDVIRGTVTGSGEYKTY